MNINPPTFRVVELLHASKTSKARRPCVVHACRGKGAEGKPWCIEHIERAPYVANLIHEMEEQKREARGARVDLLGLSAREALHELRAAGGTLTVPGLRRQLNLDAEHMARVAKALSRAGLVRVGRLETRAGVVTLELVA